MSWVDWDARRDPSAAARVHRAARRAAPRPPGVPPAPVLPGPAAERRQQRLGDIAWFTPDGTRDERRRTGTRATPSPSAVFLNGERDRRARPARRSRSSTTRSCCSSTPTTRTVDFTAAAGRVRRVVVGALDTATTARGPRTAATPSARRRRRGPAALDPRAEAAARADATSALTAATRRRHRPSPRRPRATAAGPAGRQRPGARPATPGRSARRRGGPGATAPAGLPRPAPPTGCRCAPGFGFDDAAARAVPRRRSASRTCTCRRSCRRRPARSTATTSWTTAG